MSTSLFQNFSKNEKIFVFWQNFRTFRILFLIQGDNSAVADVSERSKDALRTVCTGAVGPDVSGRNRIGNRSYGSVAEKEIGNARMASAPFRLILGTSPVSLSLISGSLIRFIMRPQSDSRFRRSSERLVGPGRSARDYGTVAIAPLIRRGRSCA